MSVRTKTVDINGTEYRIRELTAGYLRLHGQNTTTPEANIDALALHVLGEDGKPLLERVDDEIPLRDVEGLIDAIASLSEMTAGKGSASGA